MTGHERHTGMTEEEVTQLVHEEFARPMIRAQKRDSDAFSFFAEQSRDSDDMRMWLTRVLLITSLAGFVAGLIVILFGGVLAVALIVCLVSYLLLFGCLVATRAVF